MKDFSAKNKLVVYITSRVKSIPNYEQLRGTTELVKFICNASESEINNSGKKIYQRIDKKEILNDVMAKLFPNITDAEKQTIDDQVLFLLNNNHIKTLGVWKSFVKFLFGSTTDNMRDAFDGFNPHAAELDLRTLASNHQTVVNNHYHGGGLPAPPINAFYQMPTKKSKTIVQYAYPDYVSPPVNGEYHPTSASMWPSMEEVEELSKLDDGCWEQDDGPSHWEEEPQVMLQAPPRPKAASVPSRASRPSVPSLSSIPNIPSITIPSITVPSITVPQIRFSQVGR